MSTYPISFESFPERDQKNLRVLRKYFDPAVIRSLLVLPDVSVYHHTDADWERLQISGPLFVLSVNGCCYPYLFLMNNQCFKNTADFDLPVPTRFRSYVDGTKFYLDVYGDMYLFACERKRDAAKLQATLRSFTPETSDVLPRCQRSGSAL